MNAREVASKVTILLEEPGIARRNNREIVVDFIPDPTGFIAALETAHRVTDSSSSSHLPTLLATISTSDSLEDFAERTGAEEGKVSVRASRWIKRACQPIEATSRPQEIMPPLRFRIDRKIHWSGAP
jgi:hypothetical protein